MDLLDRLRLQHPIVQAGMGGGISGPELAGAVSAAGGLGTVGIVLDPQELRDRILRARALAPGRPVAANLLMRFVSKRHVWPVWTPVPTASCCSVALTQGW